MTHDELITGVLIGKKSNQSGINAYQIEFFSPSEDSIQELVGRCIQLSSMSCCLQRLDSQMAGVAKGYLVQAHAGVNEAVSQQCGCACMNDTLAAFLIGAGTCT